MPRLSGRVGGHEVRAVLFDAGGTLVRLDYAEIIERAHRRGQGLSEAALAGAEARARIDIDRRAARAGAVTERDADRVAGYFGSLLRHAGVEAELAARLALDLAAAHADDNLWRVPLPGAHATLHGLREQGFATGVVSNADGRVEGILTRAGLRPQLDFVIDSHLEGIEKPDPEIFRRALARLALAPHEALYVGDIYAIDAVGARAAGLHPVVIDETGRYGHLDCPTIRRLSHLLD